ncbi:hypothetical protein L208DRAFT_1341568, partial [Tricholoma matsutake]
KRANQTVRWANKVIPKLILPYMEYVHQTLSLCSQPDVSWPICMCQEGGQSLQIAIVHFSANVCHTILESLTIHSCSCAPVFRQLMQWGPFPCSPLVPTLVVDLQVLEFVTCLFVHTPPNNTGWCKTIEEFLDSQGYKLTTKVSSFIEYDMALLKYHAGFSS